MPVKKITLVEFHKLLKDQGVPREHLAFECPVCHTIQSMHSLIQAGCEKERVDNYIAFSCVGRFTKAGSHKTGEPAGRGCDWTLGGLLHLHTLEIDDGEGEPRMLFQPATAEQAKKLMESWGANATA